MRALVLCLAGLALASPAAAQQHQHRAQAAGCPAGQTCPMHASMSAANMDAIMKFAPGLLLDRAKDLTLSNEQVSQLTVLRDAVAKAVEQAGTAPMNHAMCIQASAAMMSKALLTEAQVATLAKPKE